MNIGCCCCCCVLFDKHFFWLLRRRKLNYKHVVKARASSNTLPVALLKFFSIMRNTAIVDENVGAVISINGIHFSPLPKNIRKKFKIFNAQMIK